MGQTAYILQQEITTEAGGTRQRDKDGEAPDSHGDTSPLGVYQRLPLEL